MQDAYEQALRDEIRASIEVIRCYPTRIEDCVRRVSTAEGVEDMHDWAAERSTLRTLLHLRRVARHYAAQVTA
jgi:hypothetical protein